MPRTTSNIALLRRLEDREKRLRTLAGDPHMEALILDADLLHEAQAALASMQQERWFPVTSPITSRQANQSGPSPAQIPWSVAERAYAGYVGRYGREQSLERVAERGGWYAEELDDLLPGWREEVSEITQLRAQLHEAEAQARSLQADLEVALVRLEWACAFYAGWYDGKISQQLTAGAVAYEFVTAIRRALQVLRRPAVDPPGLDITPRPSHPPDETCPRCESSVTDPERRALDSIPEVDDAD